MYWITNDLSNCLSHKHPVIQVCNLDFPLCLKTTVWQSNIRFPIFPGFLNDFIRLISLKVTVKDKEGKQEIFEKVNGWNLRA